MDKEVNLFSLVIAHRIRQSRKVMGLSQAELGKAIGSQSMISQFESGRVIPSQDILESISERLSDERLLSYARQLSNGSNIELSVSLTNYRDFTVVLEDQRGRWHSPHITVAKQIIDVLYNADIQNDLENFIKVVLTRCDDPTLLAVAHFSLGGLLLRQGKYTEARASLEMAFSNRTYLDEDMRARLHYNMGYLFTYLDYQGLALWHASQAVNGFQDVFIPQLQAKALALEGTIHVELGQFDQARLILNRALNVLKSLNDSDAGRILNTMADAELLTDNYDQSESYAKQALQRVKLEDFLCQSDIYRVLAEVEVRRGNLHAAEGYLGLSFEFADQAKDSTNEAYLCLLAIEIAHEIETKIKYAKRAFDLTKDTGDYHIHAFASEYMANFLKRLDYPMKDILYYMDCALNAYRTHVEKHSKFSITARRLKVFADSV